MNKLRLAILDYTKEQLDSPTAQQILSHVIFEKQKNFLRTDQNYVVMDKHDMIGTHYLIYDTSNLLQPKLIFAIRTTFLSRASKHKIETPLQSLIPALDLENQNAYRKFFAKHPDLVDCNAWFVNPEYSKKNSGLNLSDLGYALVTMNLLREGFNNFVGCTNETYNASRWLKNVGEMDETNNFIHPAVQAPHKLILMENFNLKHAAKVYLENKSLFDNTFEVFADGFKPNQNMGEFIKAILTETRITPVEAELVA